MAVVCRPTLDPSILHRRTCSSFRVSGIPLPGNGFRLSAAGMRDVGERQEKPVCGGFKVRFTPEAHFRPSGASE